MKIYCMGLRKIDAYYTKIKLSTVYSNSNEDQHA